MSELYIGLISGTSMDGIDAVLADFSGQQARMLQGHSHAVPADLQADIAALALNRGDIRQLGLLDHRFGLCLVDAVQALLDKAAVPASDIRAIGSHGQTVYHYPQPPHPFTLQIGDPNLLAQHTGITTVADLRRRDMAAGGQGAPLVPAFHLERFHDPAENRVVLNIGGIANITVLPASRASGVIGFDTGPGNTLLDSWYRKHHDQGRYDRNGDWGAGGETDAALLETLVQDPYFAARPPKSTGPEYFNLKWLEKKLPASIPPQSVQATLAALTAITVADAVRAQSTDCKRLLVCGGGVHNEDLLRRLRSHLAGVTVESTAAQGLDPDWVEAMAFAWLARRTLNHQPGNLPAVTGADTEVVLGGIYPGGERFM